MRGGCSIHNLCWKKHWYRKGHHQNVLARAKMCTVKTLWIVLMPILSSVRPTSRCSAEWSSSYCKPCLKPWSSRILGTCQVLVGGTHSRSTMTFISIAIAQSAVLPASQSATDSIISSTVWEYKLYISTDPLCISVEKHIFFVSFTNLLSKIQLITWLTFFEKFSFINLEKCPIVIVYCIVNIPVHLFACIANLPIKSCGWIIFLDCFKFLFENNL